MRYLAKCKGVAVVALVWALLTSPLFLGCTTVSTEAQKELQQGAQIGQGLYRDWEKLSPEEQRQSFWAIERVLVDLDYSIMSTPIPPAFVGPYAVAPK